MHSGEGRLTGLGEGVAPGVDTSVGHVDAIESPQSCDGGDTVGGTGRGLGRLVLPRLRLPGLPRASGPVSASLKTGCCPPAGRGSRLSTNYSCFS